MVRWQGQVPIRPVAFALTGESEEDLMRALLQEFRELFKAPCGMPPKQRYDHRIHLVAGTDAVPVRPYQYPQLQKDELKRQCVEMLQHGIIRITTSQFSSPVLLVKKQDAPSSATTVALPSYALARLMVVSIIWGTCRPMSILSSS